MLNSTHEIDGTRNMVVYACPRTNRMVCKNGGNCFTGTGHDEGYLDEFMLVDDGIEVNRRFLTQKFGSLWIMTITSGFVQYN